MTTLFLTLSLSGSVLAQPGLMVGNTPLAEIETEFVELQIVPKRILGIEKRFLLLYGQPCVNRLLFRMDEGIFDTCTGLKDASGTPVVSNHYVPVLNLLKQEGWEVVDSWQIQIDGNANGTDDLVFLLRRTGAGFSE